MTVRCQQLPTKILAFWPIMRQAAHLEGDPNGQVLSTATRWADLFHYMVLQRKRCWSNLVPRERWEEGERGEGGGEGGEGKENGEGRGRRNFDKRSFCGEGEARPPSLPFMRSCWARNWQDCSATVCVFTKGWDYSFPRLESVARRGRWDLDSIKFQRVMWR